jgi:tRNA(Ile)-lysidine synthase
LAKRNAILDFDRHIFSAGDRVCCAVSGGADSVALLLGLRESNGAKESLGIVLSAVHVHHGLRGDAADDDEAFVRALCEQIGVPLAVERVDTPARQESAREGIEEAARALRYGVFWSLLGSGRADLVATAHTLDDQAETVVMKFLRGAWTEGLGGISRVVEKHGLASGMQGAGRGSGRIVRPLLNVRRAAVEDFLRERGQEWREDETNRDLSLTRNRVRHELMPTLRTFNPGIDAALARLADIARDDEAFWGAEVARAAPGIVLPGRPVRGGGRQARTAVGDAERSLDLIRLQGLAPALRRRVVRLAAREIGLRLSAEETAKLLALAGLELHAGVKGRIGSRLELANGLRAERSARELRLWRQL